MTEAEWLISTDMGLMFRLVRGRVSQRKWRLYACGWCRLNWDKLTDARSRTAVEIGERCADGLATELVRDDAYREALAATMSLTGQNSQRLSGSWAGAALADSCVNSNATAWTNAAEAAHRQGIDEAAQTALLREIIDNPFRHVALDRSWLTPTVTSLAQTIYDHRQLPSGLFDNHRLGILADALEEAGCDNADILGHLRGGGEHARGCWAVDLILGKE